MTYIYISISSNEFNNDYNYFLKSSCMIKRVHKLLNILSNIFICLFAMHFLKIVSVQSIQSVLVDTLHLQVNRDFSVQYFFSFEKKSRKPLKLIDLKADSNFMCEIHRSEDCHEFFGPRSVQFSVEGKTKIFIKKNYFNHN